MIVVVPTRRSLTLLLLASASSAATAQERSELPQFSDAEVRTVPVAELSFAGLDVAPDVMSSVFRLPNGEWGVSSRVFDGVIQRFHATGAPAGTLGRAGEGPGEFGGQVYAADMGGEIALVDPANGRLSVFDRDLSLIYERPLPGRARFVTPSRTVEGSVLITGFMMDGGETHPVARLGPDPADDRFGGEIESDNARVSLKVAAEDADGRVWTLANSGGAVNVLSADDLRVLARWRLPGEEFQQEASRRPERGKPPVPQALGAGAGDGVVWLLIGVADEDWSPEVNPARDGAGAYWDTRVLAIDTDRPAIVGQARLDQLCLPVAGDKISCVDELSEKVRVLRLELTRPEAP